MYEYKRGKYRLRKRIGLLLFCVLITAFLSSCSLFMPTFSDLSDSTHVSTDVSDATRHLQWSLMLIRPRTQHRYRHRNQPQYQHRYLQRIRLRCRYRKGADLDADTD